jgi:hypothetical protein
VLIRATIIEQILTAVGEMTRPKVSDEVLFARFETATNWTERNTAKKDLCKRAGFVENEYNIKNALNDLKKLAGSVAGCATEKLRVRIFAMLQGRLADEWREKLESVNPALDELDKVWLRGVLSQSKKNSKKFKCVKNSVEYNELCKWYEYRHVVDDKNVHVFDEVKLSAIEGAALYYTIIIQQHPYLREIYVGTAEALTHATDDGNDGDAAVLSCNTENRHLFDLEKNNLQAALAKCASCHMLRIEKAKAIRDWIGNRTCIIWQCPKACEVTIKF